MLNIDFPHAGEYDKSRIISGNPGQGEGCSEKRPRIYMVGIKGTGMTALAEILFSRNIHITGSDVDEEFYTDGILKSLGLEYYNGFSSFNMDDQIRRVKPDLVIYSAAYDPLTHPELLVAGAADIPMMEYSEALGELSRGVESGAVSGVHGKDYHNGHSRKPGEISWSVWNGPGRIRGDRIRREIHPSSRGMIFLLPKPASTEGIFCSIIRNK